MHKFPSGGDQHLKMTVTVFNNTVVTLLAQVGHLCPIELGTLDLETSSSTDPGPKEAIGSCDHRTHVS